MDKEEKEKETTTKTKKRYIILPPEKKLEIKTRYELGENLFNLAIEYKVNYDTLKNYSSKKDWEKGKHAEVVKLKVEKEVTKTLEEQLIKCNKEHLYIHNKFIDKLRAEAEQGTSISKSKADAYKSYIQAVVSSYELGCKMLGKKTEREKIDDEIQRIKLDVLKEERAKSKLKTFEME